MPLGEFVAEIGLRIFLEIVFYGVAYYTGYAIVIVITLGIVQPAPLSTIDRRNRSKTKKKESDWGIWLYPPMKPKLLKAGIVCIIGVATWAAIGVCTYFLTR